MPDEAHSFLSALVTSDGPFRRADLAGLDHESSRVVIHRLLDEGVLVETEPGRLGVSDRFVCSDASVDAG